jgi:DNA ligase 4
MVIYYDLLMVDGESLLSTRHFKRFGRLENLITQRKGHAEIVKRRIIPFSRPDAAALVRKEFANCIVSRGEGLVLKPDDPYFSFGLQPKKYSSCNIKLKKEYIQGWGDVGDFAVVGALYDAAKAKTYQIPNLKYTHFFIGCIENRDRAKIKTQKPRFMVTNIVELPEALVKVFRTHCNPAAVPPEQNSFIELAYKGVGFAKEPDAIFPDPPVFDMRCFSFDKEPNSTTWSMRFPMPTKIHFDRSYLDVMSFDELQEAAQAATELPEEEDSQEMRLWVSKLEKVDSRGKASGPASQGSSWSDSMASSGGGTTPPSSPDDQRLGPSWPTATVEIHTDAAVSAALARPPTSSAVGNGSVPVSDATDTAAIRASGVKKRRRESSVNPDNAKRHRRHSGLTHGPISLNSSLGGPNSSPTKGREPLEVIDGNTKIVRQGSDNVTSNPALLESDVLPIPDGGRGYSSPLTGPVCSTREICSSPPRPSRASRNPQDSKCAGAECQSPRNIAGCSYTKRRKTCAFANCSFLLAPCISQYAWVSDLLHRHGLLDFAVDPASWTAPSLSGASPCGSMPVSAGPILDTIGASVRGRVRRICLVEAQRPEATMKFLGKIEAAGLKRRNGQREWVSVYDWRILEDMAKVESGSVSKGPDPWRARYFGIA